MRSHLLRAIAKVIIINSPTSEARGRAAIAEPLTQGVIFSQWKSTQRPIRCHLRKSHPTKIKSGFDPKSSASMYGSKLGASSSMKTISIAFCISSQNGDSTFVKLLTIRTDHIVSHPRGRRLIQRALRPLRKANHKSKHVRRARESFAWTRAPRQATAPREQGF